MALSEKQILKLKVDYESGKLSKTSICKKHRVSRPTLRKHAKDNGWKFQKNFQEISKIVEEKTIEKIIEKETEKLTDLTTEFFTDIGTFKNLSRAMANDTISALKKAAEDSRGGKKVSVSKDEFDRIFAGSKIVKINIEALSIAYDRLRKAHGLDVPEPAAKIEINTQNQVVISDKESSKLFADAMEKEE